MEAVTPENTRKHPFRVSPDSHKTPENTLSPFRGRVESGVGIGPGVWLHAHLLQERAHMQSTDLPLRQNSCRLHRSTPGGGDEGRTWHDTDRYSRTER